MESTDHLTDNGLETHDLSTIVPEMTPEDFGRLKESIAQRGFLVEHSIVLFEGRILDGGHRYKAAQQLGVTPTFREFIGSEAQARAFILASNADRRHLTKSQVAQVFVNANALAPEKSQLTTKQISAQSGATEKAVRDAQKLREKNPDDAAKVASGEKPAGKAKAKAGITPPAGRVRQQAAVAGIRVVSVNIQASMWNALIDKGKHLELTGLQALKTACKIWLDPAVDAEAYRK